MNHLNTGSRIAALMMIALALVAGSLGAQSPQAPTQLFVDSADAQTGAKGNPVVDVDTTPVCSSP